MFCSEFGFRWRQYVINAESKVAKPFCSVTDPGILLHMSWTPEGEEGSKLFGSSVHPFKRALRGKMTANFSETLIALDLKKEKNLPKTE